MQNKEDSNNFKDGLKGTSLFGGVQVFKIAIAVLRSKILAVLLGPSGVGVLGLLTSTLDVIYSISNLGLATSAVRDISEANSDNNREKLSRTVVVFRKLVWITGLFGLSICLFLSPYWSKASFGNHDYVFTFCLLSLTVLFRLLSEGQNALLQGTHHLRYMAKSNVIGNAIGFAVSVPFYYFWGIAGIGPSLFFFYLINLALSWYFSRKVYIDNIKVSLTEVLLDGRNMLKLGFFLSLSGLLTSGVAYIIRLYISNKGGLDDVGLYTAGFAIVNTYVGMVFTAMGTEYLPRISSYAKDVEQFTKAINSQMEISILLIAPLICAFIIFGDLGVQLLYSRDFLSIDLMICFAIFAVFFKAPSWCCSYAIIAKGDSVLFFVGELFSLFVMLASNIILYKYYGLTGLGVAYIVIYGYYMAQEWFICKLKYKLCLTKSVYMCYVPQLAFCTLCFYISYAFQSYIRYTIGIIPFCLSLTFSYMMINRKVNIVKYIKSKMG